LRLRFSGDDLGDEAETVGTGEGSVEEVVAAGMSEPVFNCSGEIGSA
jgi:hypothetical protein